MAPACTSDAALQATPSSSVAARRAQRRASSWGSSFRAPSCPHTAARFGARTGPAGIDGARFLIELPRGQPPVDDGSSVAAAPESGAA